MSPIDKRPLAAGFCQRLAAESSLLSFYALVHLLGNAVAAAMGLRVRRIRMSGQRLAKSVARDSGYLSRARLTRAGTDKLVSPLLSKIPQIASETSKNLYRAK